MKKYKLSLVFTLFLLTIFLVSNSGVVNAIDYSFIFEQNILYDEAVPYDDISQSFNIRDKTRYNGDFNATFSFADDIVGTSPIEWNYFNGDGVTTTIISSLGDHEKVFQFYTPGTGVRWNLNTLFSPRVTGEIEFWFRTTDETRDNAIRLINGGNAIIVNLNAFAEVGNDIWYYYEISWDTDTDLYSHWLNGVLIDDDVAFDAVSDGIDQLTFISNELNTEFYSYIDGLDFSWTPGYEDGRSRFSLTGADDSVKEIDRYEFALTTINNKHAVGAGNLNGWLDYETGGGDAYANVDSGDSNDMLYQIAAGPDVGDVGIYKDDFVINTTQLDVAFKIEFVDWNVNAEFINFTIYSSDRNPIVDISFVKGAGSTIHMNVLANGVLTYVDEVYMSDVISFNVYIDYFFDITIIEWSFDAFSTYEHVELDILSGKEGLYKIFTHAASDTGNYIKYYVDYIGIYVESVPITGMAYGWFEVPVSDSDWDNEINNLFYMNADGICTISKYVSNDSRVAYEVEDYIEDITAHVNHAPGVQLYNLYDEPNVSYVEFPSLIVTLQLDLELTDILIDGVLLTEGFNEYPLLFKYGSVDIDESYFRVDSDNKLQFQLYINDNESEYIEATFDIDDVQSKNKTIGFISFITGGSWGVFDVDYDDATHTYIDFPWIQSNINILLPQAKMIEEFGIIISDNNEDDNDYSYGFVVGISLKDYLDYSIDVTISNLISMMVPIIIMIVPPLTLSGKFGKKVIFPFFIFMAILCFITSLIPAWLFFIIAIGCAGFIFTYQKKKKGS